MNGIAPLKRRPKMAIIPAGTTNDYARALKIPRDNIVKAAEVIKKKIKLSKWILAKPAKITLSILRRVVI